MTEDVHRWELAGTSFTVQMDERQPDRVLRWHSIDGPPCDEVVAIKELTPRRCQVTVELNGPATLIDGLAVDLPEFKRRVEQDHPPIGHFVNERPSGDWRHRSNWRDQRMIGRTSGSDRLDGKRRPSTSERQTRPGFAP